VALRESGFNQSFFPMVLCMSQVDRTQATFGFQHRGDTANVLNRRFAAVAWGKFTLAFLADATVLL